MVSRCPRCEQDKLFRKDGFFYRKTDRVRVQRFVCLVCFKRMSSATFDPCIFQKKRHLNNLVTDLLCSSVSQRRCSLLLGINLKTVARKFHFAAQLIRDQKQTNHIPTLKEIQFDDMETSIHSKLKPVSIALAVNKKTREILDFQVSSMPPKGTTARLSYKKYGLREDNRIKGWTSLFENLKYKAIQQAVIESDQNPNYLSLIAKHFPEAEHIAHKGKRGCVVGQGELKKVGFDPLFSLNHTAAMLRANINRLHRRTWCTSKTMEGLIDHITLHVQSHNKKLIPTYHHD